MFHQCLTQTKVNSERLKIQANNFKTLDTHVVQNLASQLPWVVVIYDGVPHSLHDPPALQPFLVWTTASRQYNSMGGSGRRFINPRVRTGPFETQKRECMGWSENLDFWKPSVLCVIIGSYGIQVRLCNPEWAAISPIAYVLIALR